LPSSFCWKKNTEIVVQLRMDQQKPTRLIGVYNADGGVVGELKYFFGHLVGIAKCELCDITHSPIRRKASFDRLAAELKTEYGLDFALLHLNERTEAETKASAAKEPCVLAEYPDGSLGMFLDRQELRVVDGDIDRFAKLVRARLALFF
jgi:hypothetical protein